jgi:hypothetical protein
VIGAGSGIRSWTGPLACALTACTMSVVLCLQQPFGVHDEGFQYLQSWAWAHGGLLFSRFDVLYPIGQYVWFGTLMRLLGDGLWVLRVARALLAGVAAGVFSAAVRRVAGGHAAWVVALACATVTVNAPTVVASSIVFSGAMQLVATARIPRRSVFVLGAAAGLLAGWREDAAFLALIVACLAVVLRREPREAATRVLPGLLAGVAPWRLITASRAEVLPFLAHLGRRFLFLFQRLPHPVRHHYRWALALPNSPRELAALFVPAFWILLPVTYLAIVAYQIRQWRGGREIRWPAVAAALVGLAYLPAFLWELPDLPHLRSQLPLLVAVLGVASSTFTAFRRRLLVTGLFVFAGLLTVGLAVQHWVSQVPLYPCGEGQRIGARPEYGIPPWAGLPRRPGETLIVLGFGPGWYVLEGLEPGTRFLATDLHHMARPEKLGQLVDDLRRTQNRWVIAIAGGVQGGEIPPAASTVLAKEYHRVNVWSGWELWER